MSRIIKTSFADDGDDRTLGRLADALEQREPELRKVIGQPENPDVTPALNDGQEWISNLPAMPPVPGPNQKTAMFMQAPDLSVVLRGGPGSGHFGHAGRPGEQGGSQPSDFHEAMPTADIKKMRFFHGTAERAGKAILKEGIVKPLPMDQRHAKGWMAPVEGRVYVATDPEFAFIYALGGDMAGSELPDSMIKKEGRYGYLFELEADSLDDIQPDEDSIGIAFSNQKYEWLVDLGNRHLKGRMLEDARQGMFPAAAKAGKILARHMTDNQKLEMIRDGAAIANQGDLRVVRAWKIDRTRSSEYEKRDYDKPDSKKQIESRRRRIFRLSEEIELTERGGPGSGHFGHKGIPEHRGGSQPGDFHSGEKAGEKKRVGITSSRPGKPNAQVFEEMRQFKDRLLALPTVANAEVEPGLGGWQDETGQIVREPTWVVSYEGNGEAQALLEETAKQYEQDAVVVMGGTDGEDAPMSRIVFGDNVTPEERDAIQTSAAEHGFAGWTWYRDEQGRAVMELVTVPQWGGDVGKHVLNAAALSNDIRAIGQPSEISNQSVKVSVVETRKGMEPPDLHEGETTTIGEEGNVHGFYRLSVGELDVEREKYGVEYRADKIRTNPEGFVKMAQDGPAPDLKSLKFNATNPSPAFGSEAGGWTEFQFENPEKNVYVQMGEENGLEVATIEALIPGGGGGTEVIHSLRDWADLTGGMMSVWRITNPKFFEKFKFWTRNRIRDGQSADYVKWDYRRQQGIEERSILTLTRRLTLRGGPGSGHHGHEGRPGEVGGSTPSDFHSAQKRRSYPDDMQETRRRIESLGGTVAWSKDDLDKLWDRNAERRMESRLSDFKPEDREYWRGHFEDRLAKEIRTDKGRDQMTIAFDASGGRLMSERQVRAYLDAYEGLLQDGAFAESPMALILTPTPTEEELDAFVEKHPRRGAFAKSELNDGAAGKYLSYMRGFWAFDYPDMFGVSGEKWWDEEHKAGPSAWESTERAAAISLYSPRETGVLLHEYGHHLSSDDRFPSAWKASQQLLSTGSGDISAKNAHERPVSENISFYATTNRQELVAECYAMSRHPDYEAKATPAQREIINFVLNGGPAPSYLEGEE